MERQEFIKRMVETIVFVTDLSYHSCSAIQIAFYEDIKRQTRKRYVESIKHLFMKNSRWIDWEAMGIDCQEVEKKKKARVKWLFDFKDQCVKDNFYEGL